jgi:Sugar phosphate permease
MSVETEAKKGLLPKAHPISWWMLLVTTLAILMCSVDRIILPTLMPAIMEEFHLDKVQAGFLNSLSFVGTLVGALVLGFLSDYIGAGYKRAYSWVIAVCIEIAAGIATAFCATLGGLQALRVAMGFGSGGSEPINVALIGEWWQKENRGFAIGAHHTGFPFGQFLGPVMIGAILAIGTTTWREVFLFLPLIGVPIIIAQLYLATKKKQTLVYDWIEENGMTPPSVDFVNATQKPTLVQSLNSGLQCLKNKNCLLAIIVFFAFIWAETAIATFLTVQLTEEVKLDLATAAVISGASGITGWIGQIFWGGFSDKKGRKFCLQIIVVGWILAALACMFINSQATGWIILISWGIFRNSPFPVVYAFLVDSAPQAAASGMGLMIGIALGLSGFLAAPIAGWVIGEFGFTVHYISVAVILALAAIPMAMMKETVKSAR